MRETRVPEIFGRAGELVIAAFREPMPRSGLGRERHEAQIRHRAHRVFSSHRRKRLVAPDVFAMPGSVV